MKAKQLAEQLLTYKVLLFARPGPVQNCKTGQIQSNRYVSDHQN